MRSALQSQHARREPRVEVKLEATLFHDGIGVPVTINNISSYGALLCTRHLPPIGSQITIVTDRHELWATVIWTGEDRCGVLLSQSVDPEALGAAYPLPPVTRANVHALMGRG